jgi:hypothetical protein
MGPFCRQPNKASRLSFIRPPCMSIGMIRRGRLLLKIPILQLFLEILSNPQSAVFTHFYLSIEPYLVFVFKNSKKHFGFVFKNS